MSVSTHRPTAPRNTLLPWVICGLAAIFYCYEYLLRIAPSVMIPKLMSTFNLSATHIGTISAFYYYAYTPAQIPVGVMMDRFGPRFILSLAVLSCAVGTLLFGYATSYNAAAGGRFLIGFGSAFAFVGVLKLASVWLPPNRFAFVSGLSTALGMIGAMSGQMVMTGLVQEMGWKVTVIYSGFFGFLLAPIVWLVVRDAPYKPKSTTRRKQHLSFMTLMRQVLAIFASRQLWLNGIIGCLLYLPTTVFAELWGLQYLEAVHHMSKEKAAAAVSMVFLGWAIGGPVGGLISDKIKSRRLPIFVGAIVASALMIILLGTNQLPHLFIFGLLLVFGIFSGTQVICFAIGRENCVPHLSGTALAVTNFLIMMGGAIFQPVVGVILDANWNGTYANGLRVYTPEAYQVALMVLPLGLLLSIILLFFLKETHCKPLVRP